MDGEEYIGYKNNQETLRIFLGQKYAHLYSDGMSIHDARYEIQQFYKKLILRTLGPNKAHLYHKDMTLDEAKELKSLLQ